MSFVGSSNQLLMLLSINGVGAACMQLNKWEYVSATRHV